MKKYLVIKTIIIALCLGSMINKVAAQNDADPALTNMGFSASPIVVAHTATLTVGFSNNGFTTAIATGTVGVNISLPGSAQYTASPESIAALSGTFLSKFNWTYNSTTKAFLGINNQPILAGTSGTILVNIIGVTPVALATSVTSIQRLNPAAYPNEDVNNNNLSATLGVIPGTTTPVLLLDFNAVKQGSKVQLSWKTSSEVNSNYFDIQYSRDGVNWSSIGTLAAAGNSSIEKSYGFTHNTPAVGVNYYRLKQIDIGNAFVNSDIRTVTFASNTGIKVMPNPVVGKLYVISSTGSTFTSVGVFTADGKLLGNYYKLVSGGTIDMTRYPAGTYMLKITDAQGLTEIKTIVKDKL